MAFMKVAHEYFAYFFIIVMIAHIVYNIKPLKNYVSSKTSKFKISKEMIYNGVIAILLVALTVTVAENRMNEKLNKIAQAESTKTTIIENVNAR
jgi:DMSO/TMAO reductase YedYZ heme-binding membrane subunit